MRRRECAHQNSVSLFHTAVVNKAGSKEKHATASDKRANLFEGQLPVEFQREGDSAIRQEFPADQSGRRQANGVPVRQGTLSERCRYITK